MEESLKHIHSLFWLLLIVLYVIIPFRFRKTGAPPKLLHNLLRVTFLLTATVGIISIVVNNLGGFYHMKGTLALVMFGLMEVSLSRLYKGKTFSFFAILVSVLLILIILMGYRIVTF